MKKDTLYVDAEDDITDVVGKIKAVDAKIIALVPPKRSNVLSSAVNLKLVNKAAQDEHKRVVLITTDKTLTSLAGGIGMYVAPNQQSAPAIPAVAQPPDEIPSEIIKETEAEAADGRKFSLKRAAGAVAAAANGAPSEAGGEAEKAGAKKGLKGFRIPDFNLFRKRLVLIVAVVILLIGGSVWAFYLAPSARIWLEGQTSRIAVNTSFTADTGHSKPNFAKKLLPAASKELKKEGTETITPTGEKNIGDKATGTASIKNCERGHNRTVTLPAGTALTSGEFTFYTKESVTLPKSSFDGLNSCDTHSKSVGVTAQNAGDQYNLSPRNYSVSGHPNIYAYGSAMAGGTNEIVKVLSQTDLDNGRDTVLSKLRDGAEEALYAQFGDGVFVIKPSFAEQVGEVTPSVPVGERADTASVKVVVTFYALGVKEDTMNEFLRELQRPSLQPNQTVFNTGLDAANIQRTDMPEPGRQTFQLRTDAFAGPAVDVDQIRKELAGKGFGEARKKLESIPGVTKAEIDFSPFWVFSMPRQADHIHIDIKVD
jgi:hypothetical protein